MPESIQDIQNEKTWWRKCISILVYHTVQQSKKSGKRNQKWRVKDTARELDMSIGYISESLKLAKYIPRYEGNLKKVTREMALKIIKDNDK